VPFTKLCSDRLLGHLNCRMCLQSAADTEALVGLQRANLFLLPQESKMHLWQDLSGFTINTACVDASLETICMHAGGRIKYLHTSHALKEFGIHRSGRLQTILQSLLCPLLAPRTCSPEPAGAGCATAGSSCSTVTDGILLPAAAVSLTHVVPVLKVHL
jgi:hypothetical protein